MAYIRAKKRISFHIEPHKATEKVQADLEDDIFTPAEEVTAEDIF